jgi:hypothetical protein
MIQIFDGKVRRLKYLWSGVQDTGRFVEVRSNNCFRRKAETGGFWFMHDVSSQDMAFWRTESSAPEIATYYILSFLCLSCLISAIMICLSYLSRSLWCKDNNLPPSLNCSSKNLASWYRGNSVLEKHKRYTKTLAQVRFL